MSWPHWPEAWGECGAAGASHRGDASLRRLGIVRLLATNPPGGQPISRSKTSQKRSRSRLRIPSERS